MTEEIDTTFLAELWALERTRDLALEIADRSCAEYEADMAQLSMAMEEGK